MTSEVVSSAPDLNRTAPVLRFIDSRRIDRILELMVERGGSDLHLSVGRPPMLRRGGELEPLRHRTLTAADFEVMVGPIASPEAWQRFQSQGTATFAYQIDEVGRFRVTLLHQERGPAAVLRAVAPRIPSMMELGLPSELAQLTRFDSGLVIVAGGTRSGRSTTLAAMIELLSEARRAHIITVENPIEFVFQDRRSVIHQRELGSHARGTVEAVRAALHEDPDVVAVGDLSDPAAVCTAMEAAERGILVIGVVTARGVCRALARVASAVAMVEGEYDVALRRLADVIRGVSAQQLVPRTGGGRIAACEWLMPAAAMADLLREGRWNDLATMLRDEADGGGAAMDEVLFQLLRDGVIAGEDALNHAVDPGWIRERSRLGTSLPLPLRRDPSGTL